MAERYNSGGAWRNVDKKKETSPGYSGTVNIEGTLYFVDVWVKEAQEGKMLSMAFKKRDKQEGATQAPITAEADDVPQ